MLFSVSDFRRTGVLAAACLAAGFIALSIHVGLLAAGVPFPIPTPPLWATWLHTALVAGGLITALATAGLRGLGGSLAGQTLLAFAILVLLQETFRVAVMNGVVTGGWAYGAIGLIKPLLRSLILALLCAVAVRWARGPISAMAAALAAAAVATGAQRLINPFLNPWLDTFDHLSRAPLFVFPYPFHVTVAAYVSFIEAVVGAVILTALIWDRLPARLWARLASLALLTALIKGVVGGTVLYGVFTGDNPWIGLFSWSQFLLEFLALGALIGAVWGRLGPDGSPAGLPPP